MLLHSMIRIGKRFDCYREYLFAYKIKFSDTKPRQRPLVTDFKSGAKAAGLSLLNGWKDGVTGIVKQPRIGYQRHGVLGGAAGSLIATVNIAVKPAVATLSSITWLSRGTYASVKKAVETYKNEGRRISTKLFDTASLVDRDGQYQESEDDKVPDAAKKAAARSGFHPKVCQHILYEFEKIKIEEEQKLASTPKKKRNITNLFSKIN